MELLLDFFSFSDPNVRFVTFGSVILTATAATVGTFTFLRKKALVGDAVAHAVLPGICLAFILSGTKNPLYLIIGAFVTGWLALVIIDYISGKSRIKEDTAIGLVLAVFFGIGIFMLTIIQKTGGAAQTGLDQFLFGKAASLVGEDLISFGIVAFLLLLALLIFFKEFTILSFDEEYAKVIGLPVRRLELVLTTLTVMAVVIGIQAVGVVLMAAMLITPAAAARFWTDKLIVMIILAAVFGAISGVFGAFISYAAPAMPTGPWIVLVVSFIAFVSFLVAPKKGILYRMFKRYRFQKRMNEENLLKSLYHLGEGDQDFYAPRIKNEVLDKRFFTTQQFQNGIRNLKQQGYLKQKNNKIKLTKEGKDKGRRIVRLHRLWELYLTKYLRIAPDHVHEDAETIEHILTPEMEKRLETLLDKPEVDPHQTKIPY
ncbi:MAG: metal ABC transporter permease [Candidatus Cyclobacteriaceae bacterium M2_1C_046]